MGRPLGSKNVRPRSDAGRPRTRPITWGAAISKSLLEASDKRRTTRACAHCGTEFSAYSSGKTCSRKCSYLLRKADPDPCLARATTMGSGLRLGEGKREIVAGMLRDACDKPCRYCGSIITLENANIDHIIPLSGWRGTAISRELDRRENLQIICARCNGLKGDLTHDQFSKLLDFLRTDPAIYRRVIRRLMDSKYAWAKGARSKRTWK